MQGNITKETLSGQQMMDGNPNWWSKLFQRRLSLIRPQYELVPSSISFNSLTENPEPPQSWSQLLFTGLPGEEERPVVSHFQSKKLGNWDDHVLNPSSRVPFCNVIKQEVSQCGNGREEFQTSGPLSSWSHMVPVSSPRSSITSLNSNNILDFTYNKADHRKNQLPDLTSEVRKEKLGDRITALHQLVSPFGKTDTASVLLEAIGYIRFLQGQIEALSSPYLGNESKNMRNQQSDAKDKPRDLRS